jgi:hypothetical protein
LAMQNLDDVTQRPDVKKAGTGPGLRSSAVE